MSIDGVPEGGTINYSYLNAGAQLTKITFPNSAVITNAFDAVGRLAETRLKNSSGTTLNLHQYGYNAAHQRTSLTNFYTNYWTFAYDTVGQLVSGTGKESSGTSRLQEQLGYAYDAAGNLSRRTNNALVQTFTPNALNELSNVTRSGTVTVAGTTTSIASSVTVNGTNSATLYADATFARGGFDPTNTIYTAIASDSLSRSSTNSISVNYPATVSFTYDANGNMLSDGGRTLSYDQENQLTSVTVTNATTGASTKTDLVYDGLNRRRIRRESVYRGGWVQTGEVRYLYDRHRIVQERDGNNVPLVTYVWGVDLSGSLEGAGGVGGLLARVDHTTGTTAYYHHDGNGNATMLINKQQLPVAKYAYEPYGKLLSKSGPLADANTRRWSDQESHDASGLVLYLYRPLSPDYQRWLNRDPAENRTAELSLKYHSLSRRSATARHMETILGANLYRFNSNSPTDHVDPDGRWGIKVGGINWGIGDPSLDFDFNNQDWNDLAQQYQNNRKPYFWCGAAATKSAQYYRFQNPLQNAIAFWFDGLFLGNEAGFGISVIGGFLTE